jgi:hypothetical protein
MYELKEQTETQEQEGTQYEWLDELFGPVCNTLLEVILFFNIQ